MHTHIHTHTYIHIQTTHIDAHHHNTHAHTQKHTRESTAHQVHSKQGKHALMFSCTHGTWDTAKRDTHTDIHNHSNSNNSL